MLTLKDCDTITVIEPHHDDFCINMFGTMLTLAKQKTLMKLNIVTVFSKGAGISKMPTSVIQPFFPEIQFRAYDLNLRMIMKGGGAEDRKIQSYNCQSFDVQFGMENHMTPEHLRGMILALCEGTVIGPMGFKHPDHNFLSRLEVAELFYREYPYYWNRSESFDRRLYEYNVYQLHDRLELSNEISDFKWQTVSTIYKDVMGTFNPRFMRPYFRNVRSEEVYVHVEGKVMNDVKNCIVGDRDYVTEKETTHQWI